MNKKAGATSESIQMTYRLIILFFIVVIVLGINSFVYGVYINTRDSESQILLKNLKECLINDNQLNLNQEVLENNSSILDYCKFSNLPNSYVQITINIPNEKVILFQGDSGKKWIHDFFVNNPDETRIKTYKPGYAKQIFNSNLIYNSKSIDSLSSNILMEVFIFDNET